MGEESLSLLSAVHGAALSSLDIILDDHSWNTVPSQTSALDKLLTTTSMFPSLKRVHITCGWGVEIRKAFVECEEQGLLTITTLTPVSCLELLCVSGSNCGSGLFHVSHDDSPCLQRIITI